MDLNYVASLNPRLNAEALRVVEESGQHLQASAQIEQAVSQGKATVEQRIIERASLLGPDIGLQHSLQYVQRLAKQLSLGFIALFLLFGAMASLQAFSHGAAQVNFYWLLLVLLGLNLGSLILWVISMWQGNRLGDQPLLARSGTFLLKRWINKHDGASSTHALTARAWFGVMLDGANGRWNLSCLSHLLWSAYLIGGLLMTLLLFSARQYDFAWETTLLQESSFVRMTQWLSALPHQLGWTTPTLEQITQSRLGADARLLAEARQSWASLLIASLLIYGLLPRLLLLGFCAIMRARALSAYRLLLSRPYYVRLRQRLLPQAAPLGVVDADDEMPHGAQPGYPRADSQPIPVDAYWLAIEWDPDTPWPLPGIPPNYDLGCVNDRESQHAALARLPKLGNHALIITVSLQRSPDRGLLRIIGKLREAHRRTSWLLLLEAPDSPMEGHTRDARLCDWYALAEQCGIDANHITQRTLPDSGQSPLIETP